MELRKKFVINAAFYGIILLLLVCTYQYIIPILMPFIVGFVVASIVQLPMNRIRTKSPAQRRLVSGALCVAFYAVVTITKNDLPMRTQCATPMLQLSLPKMPFAVLPKP